MVTETIAYICRACGSSNIVKNGHNASGSQQFWCKDCGKRGVLNPRRGYTEEQKEQIIAAYYAGHRAHLWSKPPDVSFLVEKKAQTAPPIEETLRNA